MREVIAVDICNTLADVNSEIVKATGVARPTELYFHPSTCPGWFQKNLQVFADCKPLEGSAEVLRGISNRYDIVYLSARPREAYCITTNWLESNCFPYGEVIFSDNKPMIARERNISFAFEDAPHEIEAYTKHGIYVFVKAQDYNKDFSNRFEWSDFYGFDFMGVKKQGRA